VDEYDKEALYQELWQFTGVMVAIRFWAIDDGTPCILYKAKTNERPTEGNQHIGG